MAQNFTPSRRAVARGAAWTVPAVAVAAAAPSASASPTPDCVKTHTQMYTPGENSDGTKTGTLEIMQDATADCCADSSHPITVTFTNTGSEKVVMTPSNSSAGWESSPASVAVPAGGTGSITYTYTGTQCSGTVGFNTIFTPRPTSGTVTATGGANYTF